MEKLVLLHGSTENSDVNVELTNTMKKRIAKIAKLSGLSSEIVLEQLVGYALRNCIVQGESNKWFRMDIGEETICPFHNDNK